MNRSKAIRLSRINITGIGEHPKRAEKFLASFYLIPLSEIATLLAFLVRFHHYLAFAPSSRLAKENISRPDSKTNK